MKIISRPPITVLIPTFNGRHLLEKNLPTVFSELQAGDELILIDDAGSDDTVGWISENYNLQKQQNNNETQILGSLFSSVYTNNSEKINIKFLVNKTNCRFAESCNRGVKLAQNEALILLNNDVLPHKNCFNKLLNYFSDDVFAVGCMEYARNSHNSVEKAGKNMLWFEKGLFMHSKAKNFQTGETAWASGGSALFSKSKWQLLGGFNNDYYPAYWEDIDLSFRARKSGWKVLFAADAAVDHNHESTNSDTFGQRKIMEMSWHHADIFTLKHGSFKQKIMYYFWKPYWIIKRRQALNSVK